MQKLYELAQEYSELQHSLNPDAPEINPAELTMQYIRRDKYNSNYSGGIEWILATGTIDNKFVDRVERLSPELHTYFFAL